MSALNDTSRINFCFMKKKCILQLIYAYAIMPSGKRDAKVLCEQRTKSPNRVPALSGDSSLLLWWQNTHQAICCFCRHRLTFDDVVASYTNHNGDKKRCKLCEHLRPFVFLKAIQDGWGRSTAKALFRIYFVLASSTSLYL